MITTVFLLIVSTFLTVIAEILSTISFLIPVNIVQAFQLFFSKVRIMDGIFPSTSTALSAIVFVATVYVLAYFARLIIWAYSLLPFVHHSGEFPHVRKEGGVKVREYMQRK